MQAHASYFFEPKTPCCNANVVDKDFALYERPRYSMNPFGGRKTFKIWNPIHFSWLLALQAFCLQNLVILVYFVDFNLLKKGSREVTTTWVFSTILPHRLCNLTWVPKQPTSEAIRQSCQLCQVL